MPTREHDRLEIERLREYLRFIGNILYYRKKKTEEDADMQILVKCALTTKKTAKECGYDECRTK